MLCYNGTIDSTDFHGANMANWVGDGTAYQMQVNGSATKANLQSTLTTISNRMNADSLLFVHTNNHGSPSGLCVDNSAVVTPAEWSTMLDGMKAFGTLVVTMEQCYSGAFLQPTLSHSKASRTSFASAVPADKVSAGDSHFDQWARTWFEAVNGATAYGASLAHNPDANANGRVSVREAFNYSDTYEYANSYDDPQYGDTPVGCGTQIYLTKAPTLADIIRAILSRYLLVDSHIVRHPIPDPPPEWSVKLLESLEVADALAQRFAAVEGRAVGELIEEALKNAAAIAEAGNAPASQPARLRRRRRARRRSSALTALGSPGYSVAHASNDSKDPSPASTSTLVTTADGGPLRAQSMISSSASRGPATIASTDPSRRLRTPPRTPSRRASSTIDQR